jgi:ADP-ribose pyrophosphatase
MNFEEKKQEFIKLKKEELEYFNNVAITSSKRELNGSEKLDIYRKLHDYSKRIDILSQELHHEAVMERLDNENKKRDNIIEFNVGKNFLSSLKSNKEWILKQLHIDPKTMNYVLPYAYGGYWTIWEHLVLNGQRLFDEDVYLSCGIYDTDDDDCTIFESKCGVYYDLFGTYISQEAIAASKVAEFEKDKLLIKLENRVNPYEVKEIFDEELVNEENKDIYDCVNRIRKRVCQLSYERDPKTKEKVLLDKINKLYNSVKGNYINKELLYNGGFLEVFKESYKLPNEKVIEKEKVIKNGGKDSVIVIAITEDGDYILSVQTRVKDKLIVEFTSGYIEEGEDAIEAAKRELMEETGYESNDLFILDEAITSGIDNSTSYIVVANDCVKTKKVKTDGTELVAYGLFKENELHYIVDSNLMCGAINKLAYYKLANNEYPQKVYKLNHSRKYIKLNPLDTH